MDYTCFSRSIFLTTSLFYMHNNTTTDTQNSENNFSYHFGCAGYEKEFNPIVYTGSMFKPKLALKTRFVYVLSCQGCSSVSLYRKRSIHAV